MGVVWLLVGAELCGTLEWAIEVFVLGLLEFPHPSVRRQVLLELEG